MPSFTPYMTYAVGAVLTAAQQNTYIRDNGNFFYNSLTAAQAFDLFVQQTADSQSHGLISYNNAKTDYANVVSIGGVSYLYNASGKFISVDASGNTIVNGGDIRGYATIGGCIFPLDKANQTGSGGLAGTGTIMNVSLPSAGTWLVSVQMNYSGGSGVATWSVNTIVSGGVCSSSPINNGQNTPTGTLIDRVGPGVSAVAIVVNSFAASGGTGTVSWGHALQAIRTGN